MVPYFTFAELDYAIRYIIKQERDGKNAKEANHKRTGKLHGTVAVRGASALDGVYKCKSSR